MIGILGAVVLAAIDLPGCTKKESTAPASAQNAAAVPAVSQGSAATGGSGVSSSTPASGGSADSTAKLAAAEWALKQDSIKNDPDGQWAIGASASTTYGDAEGTASWSANQVTGVPNVEKYGDDGRAWAPKTQDGGIEWLDLKYPRPVHATEVRVRESCGSGAVIKVELFDEQGAPHIVWAGNDPTTELNYLLVSFPRTSYKSDRVRVTLATNVIPGWNEIDAVQLVGKDQ